MPKLTSSQLQIEFFDRMILIEHILPLITVVHIEDLTRDLPDGWEDLLESPDFEKLAKKHFGKSINKDAEAMDLFEVLSMIVTRERNLPMGVFVCYKIPVISSLGKGDSISHSGFGRTYRHWLYLESFDHAGQEAIVADAEEKRKEQIKRLKAKPVALK